MSKLIRKMCYQILRGQKMKLPENKSHGLKAEYRLILSLLVEGIDTYTWLIQLTSRNEMSVLFPSWLSSMCWICHASSVSGMSSFISILYDVPCVFLTFTFISYSIFGLRHSSCSCPFAGGLAVVLKHHSVPAGGYSKISPVLPPYFTLTRKDITIFLRVCTGQYLVCF